MAPRRIDTRLRAQAVATPLRRRVVETIRDAIVSGRFAPGQRLVERELCEMMGVSRPSLREAIRQLESEQLVEVLPNRGMSVARLRQIDVRSIYQVRGTLEALASSLFATGATEEERTRLDDSWKMLRRAYGSEDVSRILAEKQRFYSILVEGSRNTIIQSILSSLSDRVVYLRRVTLGSAKRRKASIAEIRAVVDAIKRRDGAQAFKATEEHVNNAAAAALLSISAADRQNQGIVAS
jgi:GntR family transcriptional regulator, trigonelline degradation regulator